MPQKPLPLIISLKRWRGQNGLSQSDAVKVLNNTGIPVTLDSLQNWESGRRNPRAELALALADFLRQPTVPKKSTRQPRGIKRFAAKSTKQSRWLSLRPSVALGAPGQSPLLFRTPNDQPNALPWPT